MTMFPEEIKNEALEPSERAWDDIIPEEQLEKIKEEARKKEEELLNLGPRQRNKVNVFLIKIGPGNPKKLF